MNIGKTPDLIFEQKMNKRIIINEKYYGLITGGMKYLNTGAPSVRAKIALKSAVMDALDKKEKLGQYAVMWDREKPVEIKSPMSVDLSTKTLGRDCL